MTKDEALKMVNDILDDEMWFPNKYPDEAIPVCFIEALKACKEALEQPSQKPVGWMDSEGRFRLDFRTEIVRNIAAVNKEIPLYTHPAPSWQGLSNDRIREIGDNCLENNNGLFNWIDFARAIEQALKEKNT